MLRCLALAMRYLGETEPNPVVGAVVVKDGKILGKGAHRKAGTEHAEVLALREAGERSRGATLYVSLEPCNHQGKTGPCVEEILKSGISEVIYGLDDPNSLASGGADYLRSKGVKVRGGVLVEVITQILKPWIFKIKNGRDLVDILAVVNLDGSLTSNLPNIKNKYLLNLPNLHSKNGEDIFRKSQFDRLLVLRLNTSHLGLAWPLGQLDLSLEGFYKLGNSTISSYVLRNH